MTVITRAQREALNRVHQRMLDSKQPEDVPTYRQFRKTVQHTFYGDGCIMVRYAGMWLGIESDGYTHS